LYSDLEAFSIFALIISIAIIGYAKQSVSRLAMIYKQIGINGVAKVSQFLATKIWNEILAR
jgi:hypothetical protein